MENQPEIRLRKWLDGMYQARRLLQSKIDFMKSIISLQKLESNLKKEQMTGFDPILSLQLDAIRFLLRSIREKFGSRRK